ncbi:MAG TPA: glycosyltransferase family 4 protein [Verrucomicrobiae bacterium]
MKLLIVGDSPTKQTGFSRVVENIAKRLKVTAKSIDIWGINHQGVPHDFPYRIWPATLNGPVWYSEPNLKGLLNVLAGGDFTHVLVVQDSFAFPKWFADAFAQICGHRKIRSLYYIPVDASLDPNWLELARVVDWPVAYTHYGRMEILKAAAMAMEPWEYQTLEQRLKVLPHGVDRSIYFPLPDREKIRKQVLPNLPEGDVVLMNVNANQRRKDPVRSLEILAELLRMGERVRLVMHMPPVGHDELDLPCAGAQLGLRYGEDWLVTDMLFKGTMRTGTEEELNKIYNMGDILISSTLGEGFGLTTIEALATGMPVALPNHTACTEIVNTLAGMGTVQDPASAQACLFPTEEHTVMLPWDNARMRRRADVKGAALVIQEMIRSGEYKKRQRLSKKAAAWLSWDRVVPEFRDLLMSAPPAPVPAPVKKEEALDGGQPVAK